MSTRSFLTLLLPVVVTLPLCPRPACAQGYTPSAWPASFATYTFDDGSTIGDPEGDQSPSYSDLSDFGGATVLLASDGVNAFFRVRLKDDPTFKNSVLQSTVWLVEIAVNGTHVVSAGVNGKPAQSGDYVYVSTATASSGTPIYTNDSNQWVPPSPPSANGGSVRVTDLGNGRYFLDFQVPLQALTDISGGAVTATTPVQLFYGSSQNENNINKDYMVGSAVSFSGLATITFAEASLDLSKASSVVSGPNPPEVGQATTYDLTLTARNPGSNALGNISITDVIPAGVTLVSTSTSSGTLSSNGQTVTWNPALLQPGLSATATLRVSVSPTAGQVGQNLTLNNGASGTATDLGTNEARNATSNAVSVGPVTAPANQPDLLIKQTAQAASEYALEGTYQASPSGEQVESQTVDNGGTVSYDVKIENDGTATRTFVVKAVESAGTGWTTTYKVGTTDITAALTGSGYTTASLATGASEVVTVTLSPEATVAGGATKTATLNVYLDGSDTTVRDSVRAEATVNQRLLPDLLIKQAGEGASAYALDNTYQTTPAGDQIESQTVPSGGTVNYDVKLENDGNTTRTYLLKAAEGTGSGWTITYKVGTTDIGTAILSTGGYTSVPLAPGAATVVTVTVSPDQSVTGGATKTVTVTTHHDSGDTVVRDAVQASTTLQATAPDLSLSKSHVGDFAVGSNGTYTLTVDNAGSGSTTGAVTVTDTLPDGLTFLSGSGSGWSFSANGQTVTATRTTVLAAGATSTFTLTVGVGAAAVPAVTNTASVSTSGDSNAANNSASDPTTVTGSPHVSLSKTAQLQDSGGQPPNPARTTGTATDRIAYTLGVTNDGTTAAYSPVVVDTLPSQVQFVVGSSTATLPAGLSVTASFSNDGGATWSYTPAADAKGGDANVDAVRWVLSGPLPATAPNNVATFSFVARIPAGLPGDGVALNNATADYTDSGGAPHPRAAATASTQIKRPDLSIAPGHADTGSAGSTVVFAHTVTNLGVAEDVIDLTLQKSRPWPVTLFLDVNGDGNLDGGDVALTDSEGDGTADVGAVAAGGQARVLVRVEIPALTSQGSTATVNVIATSSLDPGRSDVTLDLLSVGTSPLMTVTKYIDTVGTTRTTAQPGATITYGITVTNAGQADAFEVVLSDTVPPFTDYVANSTKLEGVTVSPDPYTASSRTVRVVLPRLNAGASVTVTFQAVIR